MISVRKRVLFGVVLAAAIYLVAEGAAIAAYWAIFGERLSFSANAERRAAVARDPGGGWTESVDVEEEPEGDPFGGQSRRVLHPYLGYVMRPKEKPDGPFYGINFGENPIHQREPGKLIIAVVGGSVAAGLRGDGLDGLVDTLKHSVRFADKEIVVVNTAQAGFKQPQSIFALMYIESLGGEFDLVINLDGFNEVALHPSENETKGIAAIFPRNWYRWAVMSPDDEVLRLRGLRVFTERWREESAAFFARPFLHYSPTANLTWRLSDRAAAREIAAADIALMDYRPEGIAWDAAGPVRQYANGDEMFADLADIWSRCSRVLDRVCRAEGARYYHFLQPNQYLPETKRLSAQELDLAYREDAPYVAEVRAGYPFLQARGAELRGEGISYFDLTHVFEEVADTLYIDTCCHFNPEGYRILGSEIARLILEDIDREEHVR